MRRIFPPFARPVALALLWLALCAAAFAGPQTRIGPYQVEVTTQPETIPVGKAKLRFKVTADGQPVEGARIAALTKMPSMDMGERQQDAQPIAGAPGTYEVPAAFAMAGDYTSQISISGPKGDAQGSIALATGQNTAPSGGGGVPWRWLAALGAIAAAAFVYYRAVRTGQRFRTASIFNRQVLGGLALLGAMLAVSVYAVNHFRRPGSMTPIEAQAMEMEMPAPEGALPVELASVSRGEVSDTVRYTGQAVGFLEQDVYPRVQGTLEWMPFYAGDRVKKGQLLARLDTSQLAPQAAEKQAAVGVAQNNTAVARLEAQGARDAAQQAQAQLDARQGALSEARSAERQARAALANKRGALSEAVAARARSGADIAGAQSGVRAAQAALAGAQSDAAAAREERAGAQADAQAVQSQIADAQAGVDAAQADLKLARAEVERQQMLYNGGAAPLRNVQVAQAAIGNAQAGVQKAQARVDAVKANVGGANAKVRRADAMIRAAGARAREAQAAIATNRARIQAARADQNSAAARVTQAQADVTGARENIGAAGARIQQAQAALAAQNAGVKQAQSAAEAARGRIAQAQAGTKQAQAAAQGASATLGYAEIRAQLDGVVTRRIVSPGTLVSPGQSLLKVAQINPIRLQANVAESDLKRIRVGSPVTVKSSADAKTSVTARVTSVAPAVDPSSRTGLVEVVADNPGAQFKPGQYVVMQITTGQTFGALTLPSRALHFRTAPSGGMISTDATPFVWIAQAGQNGAMTARRVSVRVQSDNGTRAAVVGDLDAGAQVITSSAQGLSDGMTVMPAEGTAPGVRMAATDAKSGADAMAGMNMGAQSNGAAPRTDAMTGMKMDAKADAAPQTASVAVTESGYEPASLNLKAGVPARVTFTRKTDATCGTEVLFPDYGINQKLPLNVPVVVAFTPRKSGDYRFTCGMKMLKGTVVVR